LWRPDAKMNSLRYDFCADVQAAINPCALHV
jgi:hypothetical protein